MSYFHRSLISLSPYLAYLALRMNIYGCHRPWPFQGHQYKHLNHSLFLCQSLTSHSPYHKVDSTLRRKHCLLPYSFPFRFQQHKHHISHSACSADSTLWANFCLPCSHLH
uniref:Uncharacterized protein n=1 Tax=Opuntia streptacantha TaxID=393608 RepID=A0A7C9ETW0_OPUST